MGLKSICYAPGQNCWIFNGGHRTSNLNVLDGTREQEFDRAVALRARPAAALRLGIYDAQLFHDISCSHLTSLKEDSPNDSFDKTSHYDFIEAACMSSGYVETMVQTSR